MPSQPIHFGQYSLEDDPLQLIKSGEKIDLRPKSLSLLHYLASQPGQLISKNEILSNIWSGRVVNKDGLRVCIREIRVALEDSPEQPQYIETVPGKGYRFLAGYGKRVLLAETKELLIGRKSDLQTLSEHLNTVLQRQRQFVLLSGEPGIGKTSLLESFFKSNIDKNSTCVIKSQCAIQYGKGESYGPLLESLNHLCNSNKSDLFVKLLRQYAPMWLLQLPGIIQDSEAEQLHNRIDLTTPERMMREFCDLLDAFADHMLVIVSIEDLHWADSATINLLAAIAQRQTKKNIFILGTYRPADAVLYASYLRDMIRDLRAQNKCQELALELLSHKEVNHYLIKRLGGEVSNSLSDVIFQQTNGNPLFMVSFIGNLIKQNLLEWQNAAWTLGQPAKKILNSVPESLRSLISRRLEMLTTEERVILETASIVGLKFQVDSIANCLAKPVAEVEQICEVLASQSQVIKLINGEGLTNNDVAIEYQFQHPLFYNVLYDEIGEARRKLLLENLSKKDYTNHQLSSLSANDYIDEKTQSVKKNNRKFIPHSIAVLPFENRSPHAEHAFFAAGIHEAILNELGKIGTLHIMSKAAVINYSDLTTKDIAQIANELKVENIMEGSVQYADGRVRITVQLIDTQSSEQLWSECYNFEFKDIFSIENDIGHRVAAALKTELSSLDKDKLGEKPTALSEAYGMYLKAIGIGALAGGLDTTPEQSKLIQQSLEQALQIDPEFALAHALKARDYAYSMARLVPIADKLDIADREKLAIQHAHYALQLDPHCGLAHAGLAVAHRFSGREEQARDTFQQALELDPCEPRVLRDIAFFELFKGNYEHAHEMAQHIVEIEPGLGNFLIGYSLFPTGDIKGALSACQKLIALKPDFSLAHQLLAFTMLSKGDNDSALESLRLSEKLGYHANIYSIAQTGFAYQILGAQSDAYRIFDKLNTLAQDFVVNDTAWALVYLGIGNIEQARHCMQQAANKTLYGEDISAATIILNMLSSPQLEQEEFIKLRRSLGYSN